MVTLCLVVSGCGFRDSSLLLEILRNCFRSPWETDSNSDSAPLHSDKSHWSLQCLDVADPQILISLSMVPACPPGHCLVGQASTLLLGLNLLRLG